MALGIMLVLTIALTSTIYLTSSSARHANTSNAGQKAYALAESGINNAVAVLERQLPGHDDLPGRREPLAEHDAHEPRDDLSRPRRRSTSRHDRLQLRSTRSRSLLRGRHVHRDHVDELHRLHRRDRRHLCDGDDGRQSDRGRRQLGDLDGNAGQRPDEPELEMAVAATAFGRVKNPTGPAADVVRKATAVVPVVIPDSTSVNPTTRLARLGLRDQRVTLRPVRQRRARRSTPTGTSNSQNTATIAETIPPSAVTARRGRTGRGRTRPLADRARRTRSATSTGSADPANELAEIHVAEQVRVEART